MADELRVDLVQLRVTSRYVTDKAQLIEDRVRELDRTIGKELLTDGWRGKAASAYDESWLEWMHGAGEIIAALRDSATALTNAAGRYEAQDRDRASGLDDAGEQQP
ncbi:WXG100 family type VII secretion target [Nocardia sp. CA-128927]|uniref:WXG100 family type VII secretion target n=1 Tax=Nocardia sp. CA-128927 TaxID=3239975 RepID=UPI003D989A61